MFRNSIVTRKATEKIKEKGEKIHFKKISSKLPLLRHRRGLVVDGSLEEKDVWFWFVDFVMLPS